MQQISLNYLQFKIIKSFASKFTQNAGYSIFIVVKIKRFNQCNRLTNHNY